jgi:hypothetical protein
MFYEHKHQPVISRTAWLRRVARSGWIVAVIITIALLTGIIGYHTIGGLGWVDAFLEAAMILGGMGAIAPMHGDAVKIFAGCYALFSGFVVLTTSGIMLAPFVHRLLHRFHADSKEK